MATAGDRYSVVTGNIWSYAHRGDVTGVKAALQRGVDVDIQNTVGWTALHAAAANGRTAVLRYLINKCGARTNVKDRGGATPLLIAVQNGHVHAVQYLASSMSVKPKNTKKTTTSAAATKIQALASIRLSHAKGQAVRKLLIQARQQQQHLLQSQGEPKKALRSCKKINSNNRIILQEDEDGYVEENDPNGGSDSSSSDEEDEMPSLDSFTLAYDEDISIPSKVGYARKQSKSTAFWGPRKTPISGKIKKQILKNRRAKKKELQHQKNIQCSHDFIDNDEEVEEGNRRSPDVDTTTTTTATSTTTEMISYVETVQSVKRNRRKKRKRNGRRLKQRESPIQRSRIEDHNDEEEDEINDGKTVDENISDTEGNDDSSTNSEEEDITDQNLIVSRNNYI